MDFSISTLYVNLLLAVTLLMVLVVLYFKWIYSYWNRKGVANFPAVIPFGNAKEVVLQTVSLGLDVEKFYKQFKKLGVRYAGYYFLNRPIFIPMDLELIKMILTKDFQHFVNHGVYINEEIDPLSAHLFAMEGQKWKNLRTKLSPAFTSGKVKMMFPTMLECSSDLMFALEDVVKANAAIDIKDLIGRFTTDVIGSCAFGIDCNTIRNPTSEFRQYEKKVLEVNSVRLLKNLLSIVSPQTLKTLRIKHTRADVSKFFTDLVARTIEYREKNNVMRKDFMHLLIQLKNNVNLSEHGNVGTPSKESKQGHYFDINQLTAQAFFFFIAGYETSSTSLTFLLYELSVNPHIQDKVRNEINEVLAKHDNGITYDAVMEMQYMHRCIEEAMRKYPPLPFLPRKCTETYTVPGSDLVLEKGQLVFIPILGLQRDRVHYPDPERFDPDRFTAEAKANRSPCLWLPFGEGPRICIAYRFGMTEMKLALTVMLKNYRFSLHSKTKTPLKMDPKSFVLSALGRIWLSVEKI